MGGFCPGVESGPGEGRRVGIDAATGVNGKVNERGKEGKGECHMTHFFRMSLCVYAPADMQILRCGMGCRIEILRVRYPST